MQYINVESKDLTSGYRTFVLQRTGKGVDFFAYTGDTALGADEKGLEINAYLRGYFLRKGFSSAISDADFDVITPIYKDSDNNDVFPQSRAEAVEQIYSDKLNITGFRFSETATKTQRDEAFGKLIDCFVAASKNLDFSSDENLFIVQGNHKEVAYNNGGSQDIKIRGVDVQEKLGLSTNAVKNAQMARQMRDRMVKGL